MRLFLREIDDQVVRENFRRIEEFLNLETKLAGFVHIDVSVSSAVTEKRVAHNLGFKPMDLIRTRITGSGDLTFNYLDFNDRTITFSTTGPVRFRAFVGTFKDTVRGGVLNDDSA
jgi:hypothetical protein